MTQAILIAIVASVISGLITFTITTLAYQKFFKAMIAEGINNHEKIWHQDSMYDHVDKEISKHEIRCDAIKSIEKIEKVEKKVDKMELAVFWLVKKSGGNLSEIGLT